MTQDHVALAQLYAKKLGVNTTLRFVNPQLLMNDRLHYQRERMESKVEHALKHYDDKHPPVALAAIREDGTYWLLDGQHHAEAAVRKGLSQVPVLTLQSSGYEYEAKLFSQFQELQLDGE